MARHPRQFSHRSQAPHLPRYLLLSRKASRTGEVAQTSRRASVRRFPIGIGRRRQGTIVPSARNVRPATPAEQPPAGIPDGSFFFRFPPPFRIWLATGSPVTISRFLISLKSSSP